MLRARPLARLAGAVLAGLALAAQALAPDALLPFATVNWPDQLGGRDSLAAHRPAPLVLIVVEARRLPLAGKWAEALTARQPGLTVLTLADAPPGVPVDPARFAATLRKRVPAGVRVWMDPGRRVATALGLATSEPQLLVVAGDGRVAAQVSGRLAPDRLATVLAATGPLP